MAFVATIGAVGAIGGALITSSGAESAASSQAAAADASAQVQREQLQFQMEQYNDWKDIYGPLQESQAEYYKNLTGKELVGKELEAIQLAGQQAQTKVEQTLAQRGMGDSGLMADLSNQNLYNTEMQKALTRATADDRAAQERNKFLALGLGQGQGIMSSMDGTAGNLSNAIMQQGSAQAYGATQSADAWSTALGYTSRLAGDYFNSNYTPASSINNNSAIDLF